MRPEVQEPPLPSAVISRFPFPSRWTLLAEFVMVSISPVPKLEPGPVSYIHCESTPEPAAPLKSSLNTVVQPDGGGGTVCGDAAGAASAAGAEGGTAATRAKTGATTTAVTASRLEGRHRRAARTRRRGTC